MPLTRRTLLLLPSVPLFADMDESALAEVGKRLTEVRLARGRFLFQEGDPGSRVFFVCSGLLKVTKYGPSGRGIAIRLVPTGSIVGEVAVLDGLPYPASAEALQDTLVVGLSRKNLISVLQHHPEIGLRIMAVMAARLRTAYGELRALAADTLEQRVSMLLLKFVNEAPERDMEKAMSIPLSRLDIAELVGGAKENVSRGMARLKRLGVIKGSRGRIIIASPGKLRAFCGAALT